MFPTLAPDDVRLLDQIAMDRFGIPGILLMEHASIGLADVVCRHYGPKGNFLAIAGNGNNGGDTIAAARHLHNRGARVEIWMPFWNSDDRMPSDARTNLLIADRMGIEVRRFQDPSDACRALDGTLGWTAVLDGLFGTGLRGDLSSSRLEFLSALAKNPKGPVVAVDIPSGLNAFTGSPQPMALKAAQTVTFAFSKTGFQCKNAQPYLGELSVVDIGLPREVKESPMAFCREALGGTTLESD